MLPSVEATKVGDVNPGFAALAVTLRLVAGALAAVAEQAGIPVAAGCELGSQSVWIRLNQSQWMFSW
jgi:hypothetical protein